ncbi:tetratricopeptide repeat protein [Kaarinaea lacus]
MKKLVTLAFGLLLCTFFGGAHAVPSEVLSEISFIKKDGIDAVRLRFAIPVQYVSHAPAKRGSKLTIKIRFNPNAVPDTSELPLMESLYAPAGGPLVDVVYETIGNEPQLQLNFKREVNFSVSQTIATTSLLVFLPETEKPKAQPATPKAQPKLSVPASLTIPDPNAADTETDLKAKKMMDDGRRALRTGKYKTAIQTFSTVLSMPPNKFTQPALELLGVARERNHQAAHAKAVYEQYLEQYTEIEGAGEGVIRVRQRLAELLAAQLKPQQKLKESPREKREGKNKINSTLVGTLSQYLDYNDTVTESAGRDVRYQSVDTQLSLGWRIRSKDWEVYNYFFGNLEYDTLENDTEGVKPTSAYSRIKNRKAGIYATVGRQLGSAAGALGRFDGVYLGYDIKPKIRLNAVWGYPVDILNKRTIQSNKPMLGAGVDLFDIVKGLDISPYYIQQQVDGITDRRAVGVDSRYFQPKYNMFSRLDYDIEYASVNMFFLQGQYIVSKPTSFSLIYDYRKNPLLETSNALINLGDEVSIKDLLEGSQTDRPYSESELQDIANDRTGFISLLTLQVSHIFNARQQITVDISRSEQSVRVVNVLVNDPTVDEVLQTPASTVSNEQYDALVQLVSSRIFMPKDTAINSLRFTFADTFNETTYRLAYRIPSRQLHTEPRLLIRYRNNDAGEILYRTVPGIRLNYRTTPKLRLYLELNYEIWSFAGESQQEDFSSTNGFLGYNWTF